MLAMDLGLFHRRSHAIGVRESLVWSSIWIALALSFNAGIYFFFGPERALEFLTGYLIEKALSVDNLFVFMVLFSYFAVPASLQHRVLFWGIFGALVMRAAFIFAGTALIQQFHWVIYIFGGFLVFTGTKLLATRESGEIHPERNSVLRVFRRIMRSVPDYRGDKFTVKVAGRRYATPLLTVLVVIEATDIVFAVDSIPAIFAVTTDPFIVFTSNIFAVLGLRALYFLLGGLIGKFRYLKVGLGLVLAFVGVKMLLSGMVHVPIAISLGIVVSLLGLSVAASLLFPAKSTARNRPVVEDPQFPG
jgi:tellurite resistance protein TerC